MFPQVSGNYAGVSVLLEVVGGCIKESFVMRSNMCDETKDRLPMSDGPLVPMVARKMPRPNYLDTFSFYLTY